VIRLRKDIIETIRTLLSMGECESVRNTLRRIAEHYSSIDTYFVPRYEFRDYIEIEPNPVSLASAAKCLDDASLEILVEAELYVSRLGEYTDEWLVDPFLDSEIEMRVTGLTPVMLKRAITLLNGKKTICWVASVDKTLTGKEFLELLERTAYSEEDCTWIVNAEPVNGRTVSITSVTARFHGSIREGGVVVNVGSNIPVERGYSVFEAVDRLWKRYGAVNPAITLVMRPSM